MLSVSPSLWLHSNPIIVEFGWSLVILMYPQTVFRAPCGNNNRDVGYESLQKMLQAWIQLSEFGVVVFVCIFLCVGNAGFP